MIAISSTRVGLDASMILPMREMHCRVCGLLQDEPIWGDDGEAPSFNICPCCGCEFGTEDSHVEAMVRHRTNWMATDGAWFDPARTPSGWSRDEQLRNAARLRPPSRNTDGADFVPTFGTDSLAPQNRHAEEGRGVEAQCPYCGEITEVWVDPSGGPEQTYVEDCIVCCHPSCVRVQRDGEHISVWLELTD